MLGASESELAARLVQEKQRRRPAQRDRQGRRTEAPVPGCQRDDRDKGRVDRLLADAGLEDGLRHEHAGGGSRNRHEVADEGGLRCAAGRGLAPRLLVSRVHVVTSSWCGQIQSRMSAAASVTAARASIAAMTTQKYAVVSKTPSRKFMPMTPAIRVR